MAAVSVTVNSNVDTIATGKITVATTAAAVDVAIGFVPRYVMVVNVSTGGKCKMEWYYGMTAGHGIKTATAGDISIITSLGITPKAETSTYLGFNIGLDTDLVASEEVLYFYALA